MIQLVSYITTKHVHSFILHFSFFPVQGLYDNYFKSKTTDFVFDLQFTEVVNITFKLCFKVVLHHGFFSSNNYCQDVVGKKVSLNIYKINIYITG